MPFPPWIVEQSRTVAGCPDYGRFETTDESSFSSLLPYQVPIVRRLLRCLLPVGRARTADVQLVVDATAHVGCDTVNLASVYPNANVVAVEKDPKTCELLRRNVQQLLPGGGERVEVVAGDCLDYLQEFAARHGPACVVYLDPPWNGPDYDRGGGNDRHLCLGRERMGEVVRRLARDSAALMVVVKAPVTFDLAGFKRDIAGRAEIRDILDVCKLEDHARRSRKGAVAYQLIVVDCVRLKGGDGCNQD